MAFLVHQEINVTSIKLLPLSKTFPKHESIKNTTKIGEEEIEEIPLGNEQTVYSSMSFTNETLGVRPPKVDNFVEEGSCEENKVKIEPINSA